MSSKINTLFKSPSYPLVVVKGRDSKYPVHRIFCVGRNYAEHAKEMGVEVDREAPFYFLKDAQAIVQSGSTVAFPPGTTNYHYEIELVIAIGKSVFKADEDQAKEAIYGYATGLDMTRRDLQLDARAKQRPWDLGKNFERSAVITAITSAEAVGEIGPQRIWLTVGGETKQEAHLSDLVWTPTELVSHLSKFYHLEPGDLIYTGTPAGVGPVVSGDRIEGGVDGLDSIELFVGEPE